MSRVIIRGRALATPKSRPDTTRVFCSGCDAWYEITTDDLMIKGLKCRCGKLKMLPRFEVKGKRGRPRQVYNPRFLNPASRA